MAISTNQERQIRRQARAELALALAELDELAVPEFSPLYRLETESRMIGEQWLEDWVDAAQEGGD